MLNLDLSLQPGQPLRLLCLGAHGDDIEIGCGGTLLKWLAAYPNLEVTWVVLGARGERAVEAHCSAQHLLAPLASKQVVVKGFRDGFFPYRGEEIKDYFEQLKGQVAPDLVFTHCRHDLHQDHRLVCELTWNTFRNHLILEYEVPKYDGDLGVPNFFVHLDPSVCQVKIEHLVTHFQTQANKDWFSADAFWALLRLRGVESRAPGRYAEAFYARKVVC